jgi:O-acetyl-ADP-ribose deacetylase (regulator of RNase III)
MDLQYVYLAAIDTDLADAWRDAFAGVKNVQVVDGSILDLPVNAVVSPANSFGFMDGGIDACYTQHFGEKVQAALQDQIARLGMGELLVGEALSVRTMSEEIPWLIAAPTMRVPMWLGDKTVNSYLATKAALFSATTNGAIGSVAFPGMGTGVGRVPYDICAKQMRRAFDEVVGGQKKFPKTWRESQLSHLSLFTNSQADLQHEKLE